jgi:hypothetical protein
MNRLYIGLVRRCVILSALLLLPGLSPAIAQFEAIYADTVYMQTLTGHVQDEMGVEIEGAKIDLLDLRTDKILASTTTDSKGNFHFKDFGKTTYKLKITRPGFNVLIVTVGIQKKGTPQAIFTLPVSS